MQELRTDLILSGANITPIFSHFEFSFKDEHDLRVVQTCRTVMCSQSAGIQTKVLQNTFMYHASVTGRLWLQWMVNIQSAELGHQNPGFASRLLSVWV